MEQLTPISGDYFALSLPKEAIEIDKDWDMSELENGISYKQVTEVGKQKVGMYIFIPVDFDFELIGELSTLTEEQAREIVGEYALRQTSSGMTFTSMVDYLNFTIDRKGLNPSENKIFIIKKK